MVGGECEHDRAHDRARRDEGGGEVDRAIGDVDPTCRIATWALANARGSEDIGDRTHRTGSAYRGVRKIGFEFTHRVRKGFNG